MAAFVVSVLGPLMSKTLLNFWSKSKLGPSAEAPYLHAADLEWFKRYQPDVLRSPTVCFESFIKSSEFGATDQRQLHVSLLPTPFCGNISKAEIYILLMNPGFSPSDYYAEEDSSFRAALFSNLSQKGLDRDFPYFSLNPKFAWSGAFQWMESRLRPILKILKETKRFSHYDALSYVSKRIAVIELIPYHSNNGRALSSIGKPWQNLPSAKAAKQYVQELYDDPRQPLIVVARSRKEWGMTERTGSNIVECAFSRGVTFNPALNRAGKAILERLR
jgi:hypothetical protein